MAIFQKYVYIILDGFFFYMTYVTVRKKESWKQTIAVVPLHQHITWVHMQIMSAL